MMDLIGMYEEALVLTILAPILLNLMGTRIISKGSSIQVIALGQCAAFGILVGILPQNPSILEGAYPLIISFGICIAYYYGSSTLSNRLPSIKKDLAISFFFLFLAGQYFLTNLFPQIESHFTQAYFGDLATLERNVSLVLILATLISLIAFLFFRKNYFNQIIQNSLFKSARKERTSILFLEILILLIFIRYLGTLSVFSFLFIPCLATTLMRPGTLRQQVVISSIIAPLAAVAGLLLSINYENVPTTPTQVIMIVLLFLVIGPIILKKRRKAVAER